MSEMHSTPHPTALEQYGIENTKLQQQSLFFSFQSPSDILAPHPDLFESEIDTHLAAYDQLQLDQLSFLTVDNDAFSLLRAVQSPGHYGSLSTITASSESAYDSLSTRSESLYNEVSSFSPSHISLQDLDQDLQRIRVGSEYGATQSSMSFADGVIDPTSFGTFPPTRPRSPRVGVIQSDKHFASRGSYSDYGPPRRNSVYSQIGLAEPPLHPTFSPTHTPVLTPAPTLGMPDHGEVETKRSNPKKYKCALCPRAFARAFNLKSHSATHDPNRLKPHVCPHRECGRSFGRKHDLGRHLVSIHRAESTLSHEVANKSIGVGQAARGWCESCGKGWIGRRATCECSDVK